MCVLSTQWEKSNCESRGGKGALTDYRQLLRSVLGKRSFKNSLKTLSVQNSLQSLCILPAGMCPTM